MIASRRCPTADDSLPLAALLLTVVGGVRHRSRRRRPRRRRPISRASPPSSPSAGSRSTTSSRVTPAARTRRSSRRRSASTATGLDQAEPVRIYLYVFRNRDAFERLRATVDDCAASFVTDPETFETVEQSPFVVAAQGPWAPGLRGGPARRAGGRRRHRRLTDGTAWRRRSRMTMVRSRDRDRSSFPSPTGTTGPRSGGIRVGMLRSCPPGPVPPRSLLALALIVSLVVGRRTRRSAWVTSRPRPLADDRGERAAARSRRAPRLAVRRRRPRPPMRRATACVRAYAPSIGRPSRRVVRPRRLPAIRVAWVTRADAGTSRAQGRSRSPRPKPARAGPAARVRRASRAATTSGSRRSASTGRCRSSPARRRPTRATGCTAGAAPARTTSTCSGTPTACSSRSTTPTSAAGCRRA